MFESEIAKAELENERTSEKIAQRTATACNAACKSKIFKYAGCAVKTPEVLRDVYWVYEVLRIFIKVK